MKLPASARRLLGAPGRLPGPAFLLAALALAGAGAAALNARYYVGYFNDDASFVVLARGLWSRLLLQSPPGFDGAFSHFLPGYPLFLAPFAAAAAPRWGLLSWTTFGLTLLTVWAFWRLLGGWLEEEDRRWAVLLYAAHPLFLLCSGLVMADPFLACLFVLGLLGLRRVLDGGGRAALALLAGASLWAAASKPVGLLLPLAATAALAAARAGRPLRLFALVFWLPCAAALGAAFLSGGPTDYVTYLLRGLASLAGGPFAARLYGGLRYFVLVCGLGWFLPRGPLWDPAGAALAAAALWVCYKGLAALLARPGSGRFLALAAAGLLLGQGLVMALWTVYSERYALPMLAPLLLLLAAGLRAALPASPAVRRALLAALASSFAWRSARLAAELRAPAAPPETRLCSATLDWIRRETPPGSRFTGDTPLVYLYTGRAGEGLFAARDLDEYLLELQRNGITHVLVTARPVLSAKGSFSNDHALQKKLETAWVASHPRYFTKLFAEPLERTAVYAVKVPASRPEAARLYALALAGIRSGDLPAAEAELRRALAAEPDFPSALAALALVRLVAGREAAEPERLLRRALALEPNFPRASGALASLLEKEGRRAEAGRVREAAAAAKAQAPFEAPPL